MEHHPHLRGIRIRTVNMVMLFLSTALFIVVFHTTIQIASEYRASVKATENYIYWEKAAHNIHVGSDYLTEEARLFAHTMKKEHVLNYFNELYSNRSRESSLENITGSNVEPARREFLHKALELSNALTHKEVYAIRLVAEASRQDMSGFPESVRQTRLSADDRALDRNEKLERARDILLSKEYNECKKAITASIARFLEQNLSHTRLAQQQRTQQLGDLLKEQRITLIALCVLNILTFTMIIVLIVRPLQIYLKCIKDDKMFELVGAYEFKHLALTYNDIFTLKEHHDKLLKHKAEHDPLTGLLNRGVFDALRHILRNDPEPVGLLLVDVDKFKEVNDTYGHAVGDKILCRVAWLLRNSFRADDYCIRLGGDEFAVVLKGKAPGIENIIIEKVNAINNALQKPKDNLPRESISVGVAYSQAGFPDSLYENADSALYEVKKGGRMGCQFYGRDE